MKDGSYTIEVTMTGGTGRSQIKSPAELEIENGIMTAEIVWSSNSYDYMKVDEKEYYPISSEENSTFLVEVPALDTDIPILAETLAMSEPHLIEYTLNFNSETLKENDTFPLSAAVVGAVIAVGIIAVLFIKRKKNKRD